jgi:hypothetical protein
MRCALLMAVALTLAGCLHDAEDAAAANAAAERESQYAERRTADEKQRQSALQGMIAAYYTCVRTSAKAQMFDVRDKNLAVEQAFLACQTEEARIRTWSQLTYPGATTELVNAVMIRHKTALKHELTAAN